MKICGTVQRPVSSSSFCRKAGSSSIDDLLILEAAARSRSAFARTQ